MILLFRQCTRTNFVLFLVIVLFWCASLFGGEYDVIRINGGQPIITQSKFTSAGVPDEGENINGPSVIRLPDWIHSDNRANPDAKYYLYFAHHAGEYIRMAWTSEIEGPWHLYQVGSDVTVGNRGVLDLGDNKIYLDNGITIPNNHLASPDAYVDHESQQIILYFHSGSSTYVNGVKISGQKSYVATSADGLHFYNRIESVILGPSYFRVFKYNNNLYALTNDGTPYRALDAESPWTPPSGFDFANNLWQKHPDNLFQRDITDDGISKAALRVRHTAVRQVGDELHIFYSRRGDSPERIQMSMIDLSVGDWEQWDSTYPPVELLHANPGWEAGEFPHEPSEAGNAPENVNQLRDPYVFEDHDGSLNLFYTGCGEDAIGIAALTYNTTDISINQMSKFPGEFSLKQNYPNPFNPSIQIKFEIAHPAMVDIKIYNLNGALVETLIHEQKPVGSHMIEWRPQRIASGNYICRMKVNGDFYTRRMMYLK
jgi:hypothetical protein